MPSLHNTAASGSVKFENIIRKFATENVIKLLGLTSCIEAAEDDFGYFLRPERRKGVHTKRNGRDMMIQDYRFFT